jgi:hypothetical protein
MSTADTAKKMKRKRKKLTLLSPLFRRALDGKEGKAEGERAYGL